MSEPECDKLIELAQAGDKLAFGKLFEIYLPEIGRYVIGMGCSPNDRDDLLQEIFIKVWIALPTLKQASCFKPWLYRIATNFVRDYERKQRRQGKGPLLSLEDLSEDENVTCAHQGFEELVAENDLVRQALKEVPWKYRKSLLLEVQGKLSRKEIAKTVGISLSSVGTYISKGRWYFLQAYHHLSQPSVGERRSA